MALAGISMVQVGTCVLPWKKPWTSWQIAWFPVGCSIVARKKVENQTKLPPNASYGKGACVFVVAVANLFPPQHRQKP